LVESEKVEMDRVRHVAISIVRKQAAILNEHEAVVDRLLARDRSGAVDAMRTHLRAILSTIEMLRSKKNDYFVEEDSGSPTSNQSAGMPGRQSRKYVKSKTQQQK